MANYPFESLDEVVDVDTKKNVRELLDRGRFEDREEMMELVRQRSRDNARTPMQWDDSANAGFTDGDPWLPVNPDYTEVNAETVADPRSVLNYYRRLIELRKRNEVLVYGEYDLLTPDHEQLWVYERVLGDDRALVVLNFGGDPVEFEAPHDDGDLLIANYDDAGALADTRLRPWEARVYCV